MSPPQRLYAALLRERSAQGFWRTALELTVFQQPPEEDQWAMVGGDTDRDRLRISRQPCGDLGIQATACLL
jgi:hypothetical protein